MDEEHGPEASTTPAPSTALTPYSRTTGVSHASRAWRAARLPAAVLVGLPAVLYEHRAQVTPVVAAAAMLVLGSVLGRRGAIQGGSVTRGGGTSTSGGHGLPDGPGEHPVALDIATYHSITRLPEGTIIHQIARRVRVR
jgi:hypothetical protein